MIVMVVIVMVVVVVVVVMMMVVLSLVIGAAPLSFIYTSFSFCSSHTRTDSAGPGELCG